MSARISWVEKAKATLDVSRVGLKQLSTKNAAKSENLLAAAREIGVFLKQKKKQKKAQVVQEADEGLKGSLGQRLLLKNVFLTLKMLQNYWSKA